MILQLDEELVIEHLKDPNTSIPIIMTADFLQNIREGNKLVCKARTFKLAANLSECRIIGKFEIETYYWDLQGIDWAIDTEEEMPESIFNNFKKFCQ